MNKLFKHKKYFFLISLLIIQIILLVLIFIKKNKENFKVGNSSSIKRKSYFRNKKK